MEHREIILKILQELPKDQLRTFRFHAESHGVPRGDLDDASKREDLAKLMAETFVNDECGPKMIAILQSIRRKDLVLRFENQFTKKAPVQETMRGDLVTEVGASSQSWQAGPSSKLVTEEQLMAIAEKMGKNWKQIGIRVLRIESHKLEQIEAENQNDEVMKIFNMLKKWKNQAKKRATASQLHRLLSQDGVDLSPEVYECLGD